MIDRKYADYAWEQAATLLAIDSPSCFTANAVAWVKKTFEEMGFSAATTNKGGLLVDLGGEDPQNGLLLDAHVDTLGGMVTAIKSNGRLRISNLGGMHAENSEGENVRVHTRCGKVLEGTSQLCNPSVHVNKEYADTKRTWDTLEIVLDELTASAEETRALGVEIGDIVCFDPRTRRTATGYLKSRFLDDKLLVGILIAFAKYIADHKITLPRKTWAHITVFEEVGHGGSASIPAGVTEAIALDMGCVGDGLQCTERQVSICIKDASGPYNYDVVSKLIDAAKNADVDYALDYYPHYGSDVDASLRAGHDIRHGLIGPGVYASHGYERSHMDGVYNTLKLLCAYMQ